MKRRKTLLFIIIHLFLVVFLYFHHQTKSVHIWQRVIEIDHPVLSDELSIVTYNIRYGKGLDGKLNLKRTISTLKELEADIISLQEVERYSIRSLFNDQVTQIAKALNMNVVFYPTLSYPGFYYGNAVLSKFPIIGSELLLLENVGENRSAIFAKIEIGQNKPLTVINTHLGLNKKERLQAIAKLYEVFYALDTPILLTGDLNTTPNMNEYEIWKGLLSKSNEGTALQTFSKKDWQIDYIFHSASFLVDDVSVLESVASDHFPLIGKFRFVAE